MPIPAPIPTAAIPTAVPSAMILAGPANFKAVPKPIKAFDKPVPMPLAATPMLTPTDLITDAILSKNLS